MVDLDLTLIEALLGWLALERPTRLSSALGGGGRGTERIASICSALGASEYLSGEAGATYLDEACLSAHGVKLEYQHYQHPTYQQSFGPFVSHLSVVDLLFNHGPDSLAILTGERVAAHRPDQPRTGK